jgi:hypothetical protein
MANLEDPASGERDPRVQHTEQHGVGTRGGTPIYWQTKYPALASDIPVSRWQEPVLILAEYHALNGNLDRAVERINEVRQAAELPAFSSSDAGEIMEQLRYERKAEFWLEMRRWQDMRYYDIVPDSWTAVAKQEGVDRRFPISIRECTANTNVECP